MEMRSSTKCNFLYFMSDETERYLADALISPFLEHTQVSHNYWNNGCFKVLHLLSFYF